MSVKKILTFFGWPLLVLPTAMLYFGMSLNAICTISNNGRMPVRIANCEQVFPDPDPIHICMTKDAHAKALADIITQPYGMLSVGDMFIDASEKVAYLSYGLWIAVFGVYLIRKEKFHVG